MVFRGRNKNSEHLSDLARVIVMDAQRSPEALSTHQENELICEKLLQWKRATYESDFIQHWYDEPYGDDGAQWHTVVTPTFTTWADAGLILEALAARGVSMDISHTQTEDGQLQWGVVYWTPKRKTVDADSAPVAIRTAALNYIRSLP